MRRLASVLLILTLAACQMGATENAAPGSPATEAPVAQTEQTEATTPPTDAAPEAVPPTVLELPAPPPEDPALARQRAQCTSDGGMLTRRAPGIYACVHPTRDANRSCSAASDCEGLCLARSGTCAPFAPIYGCQEVLNSRGQRETLCLE